MARGNPQANGKRFYEAQKKRGLIKTYIWVPDDELNRDRVIRYGKRLRKEAGLALPRD